MTTMNSSDISYLLKNMADYMGIPARYFHSWQEEARIELDPAKKINRQEAFSNVVKRKRNE
ncbi:hypothetical protein HCB69_16030 [Listeria booriae]|uniref:Uncharacterized protein n=1 Tax=Listeria booriae TaxID=1552123 RepID=A0A842FJ27_9LIST|nr:hypothetical protein [Listeria booriae]MBC2285885.1 hypothetical protein [Listeria booriae]